jgi:hypothetical protein
MSVRYKTIMPGHQPIILLSIRSRPVFNETLLIFIDLRFPENLECWDLINTRYLHIFKTFG